MKRLFTLSYIFRLYQTDSDNTVYRFENSENMEIAENKQNEFLAPSATALNNVLSFARSYEAIHSKNTGAIEMILN